jgi:glycosyltransferase involved in cell wall biosynthesis
MSTAARVIITTYQQAHSLDRVLAGYLHQTRRDFTLVIADDGSSDATAALVREFAPRAEALGIRVVHVWQPDRGWRKPCILNAAVRVAGDEPLLVFTDGDCIPPAHFVESHLSVHEPWSFHVGGCYRLTREVSEGIGAEDVASGRLAQLGTAADRRDLRVRASKSRWGIRLRRPNRPKVAGLNMAYDRRLLEAVNGFDEGFSGRGAEDSDLRNRVMKHRPRPRVKVLYGEVDVYHLWHLHFGGRQDREANWARIKAGRPMRCVRGLVEGADRPEDDAFVQRYPGDESRGRADTDRGVGTRHESGNAE